MKDPTFLVPYSKRLTCIDSKKILICTPAGESHTLGCNMLESYLCIRGFEVFNISPSVPTEEIIRFIKEISLDPVLVSITLDDNISSGKRLAGKIKERFKIPVFVGRALLCKTNMEFEATVAQDLSMPEIAKMLTTI